MDVTPARLPSGWQSVALEDLQAAQPRAITDGPFGSHLTSAHYTEQGPRVVRLQNIGDGRFVDAHAHISQQHFESLRAHEVLPGDLLVASLGEEPPRACLAPSTLGQAIVKADCVRVRLAPSVDPRWVMYALQTPRVRHWATERMYGVGRPRLGLKTIRAIPVPLPPLVEQRRIVEILEDHLSRLDVATALMRESARRLRSMEAAAMSATRAGKAVALAAVAQIQGGVQKQPKRAPRDNAYPFLRVANVTAGGLDLDDIHEVELFGNELERLRLEVGDLLVVEGNGSPSQIGRAATWDGSIANCVHQNHIIRVRPGPGLLPEYLEAVWNSPETRRALTDLSSSSSGLHTLSVTKLSSLHLPIPSLEAQARATVEVHEVRDSRRRLDVAISASLARGARLRRAVLTAAFSGRLT